MSCSTCYNYLLPSCLTYFAPVSSEHKLFRNVPRTTTRRFISMNIGKILLEAFDIFTVIERDTMERFTNDFFVNFKTMLHVLNPI